MAGITSSRLVLAVLAPLFLAACEENGLLPFQQGDSAPGQALSAAPGETIERDVEAPEVFQAADEGLWDGRPSLGGVWVAHPDVRDPERVIIRNQANGNFVIGALFRRERNNPGPVIQVSSDAAQELGMLAGQPTSLDVVALRRETIEIAPPPQDEVVLAEAGLGEIEAQSLDPIESAAAAIEAAEAPVIEPAAAEIAAAPAPTAAPAPAPVSTLERPFIQIGIFSVEQNAQNTGVALRNIGIVPTILEQESSGKRFWRVIVGPATSADERRTILAQVKELGFEDAYFVTN
jgi:cell division septation protein DedD